MKTKNIITKEQKKALDILDEHGSIIRYKGGFWGAPNDPLKGCIPKTISGRLNEDLRYPLNYVGTVTIDALLKKGLIKVTDLKTSYRGDFPVKCIRVVL